MLLTVIARKECHLCDDFLDALHLYQDRIQVEVTYLDTHPELEHAYGKKVPVLLQGEKEICHYFLDIKALELTLESAV